MKQALFLAVFVLIAATGVYTLLTLYDSNMKAGRMVQTPVTRPHEAPQLLMDNRTIASGKSEALIKEKLAREKLTKEKPDITFHNALTGPSDVWLTKGEKDYNTFCSHCHGGNLDGLGTVGQSFFPLPTNLKSEKAAKLSDKDLFSIISYGTKKTPALASSMSVESRKAVIGYIRFMQKTHH